MFPTADLLAERLLKFLQLIPEDRVWYEASVWYPNAYESAESISSGMPIERVVGCISALSPQCRWEKNLCWAQRMVDDYVSGRDVTRVGTFRRRFLAWDILDTGDVSLIRGNKTKNFHHAIMGDVDAVVIDSHMSYILMGYERKYTPRQYGVCVTAMNWVSAYLGLNNTTAQAAGWLWMRKLRPKKKVTYIWWENLPELK